MNDHFQRQFVGFRRVRSACSLMLLMGLLWLNPPGSDLVKQGFAQNNPNSPLCNNPAIVSNANDSGVGSLRQAIIDVCINGRITFANNYQIYLNTALQLSKDMTIDAAGRSIIVSGDSNNDGSANVRIFDITVTTSITITHMTLEHGVGGDGGAIRNRGNLTIRDSVFRNNRAGSSGGAIYADTGTITIEQSTFDSNTAGINGGAIWIEHNTTNLINSTIVNNTAPNGGGFAAFIATANLVHTTFSANSGTNGADLRIISSSVNSSNTILANSRSGPNCAGGLAININTLIEDGSCGATITGDPLLASLADYTGSTPTMALLPGSPAIDAGDSAVCALTDQRGIARPHGVGCDLGAFESQGFSLSILAGNHQVADLASALPLALRIQAVANAANEPVGGGGVLTLSAPSSGASLNTPTLTTTLAINAQASILPIANTMSGSYSVTASLQGVANPIAFSLSNCFPNRVVSTNHDAGVGSLREALAQTCTAGTVSFAESMVITPSSRLEIFKGFTLDTEDRSITLDGSLHSNGIFYINATKPTMLKGLTLINGSGQRGAAIYNETDLYVDTSVIQANLGAGTNSNGAGIFNNGVLTVTNSLLTGNRASSGAAIYTNGSGNRTNVSNSTIISNTASFGAGFELNNGMLIINNSSIIGNQALEGSGIDTLAGTLVVANSTIAHNQATTRGGGVYIFGSSTNARLTNTTIVSNSSPSIGGLRSQGQLHLVNNLISDNAGGDCLATTLGTNNNNFVADASCAASLSGEAYLSRLGDYGGSTATIALLPSSPAIDAGDSSACASTPVVAHDQRGVVREAACDLGAFESQGFTLELVRGDQQTTVVNQPFAQALTVQVQANNPNEPILAGAISFVAPLSGASTIPTQTTRLIDQTGLVSATLNANALTGDYVVAASALGVANQLSFHLNNCAGMNMTVTSTADAGPGSLRQALEDVCDAGLIHFDSDTTIHLASPLSLNQRVTIAGAEHNVVISGDSDQNGTADVQPFLIASTASVTISNLMIVDGTATSGGAIQNQGQLWLETVRLVDNHSSAMVNGQGGGGLYNTGWASLRNCVIEQNTAARGAGIMVANGGHIHIEDCIIRTNTATTAGGGLLNALGGTIEIIDTAILSNTASIGGGLRNTGATTTMQNVLLQANQATNAGGAIHSNGVLTITQSLLLGNIVDGVQGLGAGGAIQLEVASSRTTLINVTLSANQANGGSDAGGGAIMHYDGTLNLINSTIADNQTIGLNGAGIRQVAGTVTLVNSLISNNRRNGLANDLAGNFVSGDYNLIGDLSAASLSGSTTNTLTNTAPLLAPLANYGGSNASYALLPGSPAIDAAGAAQCPSSDQRGIARAASCDIGAFESRGFQLHLVSGDQQTTLTNMPFAAPLVFSITANAAEEPVGPGGLIHLTAPNTGASISPATLTIPTTSNGLQSVMLTANAVAGSYQVLVSARGVISPLIVNLSQRQQSYVVLLPFVVRQ
ncbi:right-handed parallel beta-helix repeat-containing protein [Herpetosiphon llansteffanensis]|uniref:right-handed parallel beta-helix repeat-containing protein n=1 Tax=Herpetosiphon llansteffanensis TaxID=2094568 RepID=UPI0013DFBAC9|nr:right-handed parallel beta-helix repeat-containing protein [Herpetosiphon llansteffanensis]